MAADFSRDDLEQAFRADPKFGVECLDVFFQDEVAGYIKCVGYFRPLFEIFQAAPAGDTIVNNEEIAAFSFGHLCRSAPAAIS